MNWQLLLTGILLAGSTSCSALQNRIPPKSIRDATTTILAMREFSGRLTWYESAWRAVTDFIRRTIEGFIGWLFERLNFGTSPKAISTVAIIIAFLIIAGIVAFVIPLVVRNLRRPKIDREHNDQPMVMQGLSPDDAIAMAGKAAASGDYRHAFRMVYMACLLLMDRTGPIHFEKSRTNWEYVSALKRREHPCAGELASFTQQFDRKIYRGDEVTREEYNASLDIYSAMAGAVGMRK